MCLDSGTRVQVFWGLGSETLNPKPSKKRQEKHPGGLRKAQDQCSFAGALKARKPDTVLGFGFRLYGLWVKGLGFVGFAINQRP